MSGFDVLFLVVLGGAAVGLAIFAFHAVRNLRRWEAGRLPLDLGGPLEECTLCPIEAPRDQMHVLVDAFAEPEFGRGAGTAMIAAYCRDHCPGDCSKPEEHTP